MKAKFDDLGVLKTFAKLPEVKILGLKRAAPEPVPEPEADEEPTSVPDEPVVSIK